MKNPQISEKVHLGGGVEKQIFGGNLLTFHLENTGIMVNALTLFHSFQTCFCENLYVQNGSQRSLPLAVDNVSKETNQWCFVYLHVSIRAQPD